MAFNKNRLKELASKNPSKWLEKAKWREENEYWLKCSMQVAVRVLKTLREKKMFQVDLANLLDVSPQQINKIVKGEENLTIKTIKDLERNLGIELMQLLIEEQESEISNKRFTLLNNMKATSQGRVNEIGDPNDILQKRIISSSSKSVEQVIEEQLC